MTRRQIDASREVRLWIGQVIIPALTAGGLLMSNPDIRRYVNDKASDIKAKFKKDKES
jgi:hypothetical protein